jgi:hypothetical protein
MNENRAVTKPLAALGLVLLALLLTAGAPKDQHEPKLDALDWPVVLSSAPSPAEWKKAATFAPSRRTGERSSGCRYRHLREWVRIDCAALKVAAITQLGGQADGVSFHIEPAGEDRLPGAGSLIFPLRAGERRAFAFWTFGDGYDGPLTVVPAINVQAVWLEGAARPLLLVSDALNEPVPTAHHPR